MEAHKVRINIISFYSMYCPDNVLREEQAWSRSYIWAIEAAANLDRLPPTGYSIFMNVATAEDGRSHGIPVRYDDGRDPTRRIELKGRDHVSSFSE